MKIYKNGTELHSLITGSYKILNNCSNILPLQMLFDLICNIKILENYYISYNAILQRLDIDRKDEWKHNIFVIDNIKSLSNYDIQNINISLDDMNILLNFMEE